MYSLKVNCLGCGHTLDLRGSYNDYQGQIKCYTCGALLAVRTEGSEVKSVEYVSGRPPSAESVTRQMQQAVAETVSGRGERVMRY